MITYTGTIREDTCGATLAETYANGNRNEVIATLSNEHPAVAVNLIMKYGPFGSKFLSKQDCEDIRKQLSEHRKDYILAG